MFLTLFCNTFVISFILQHRQHGGHLSKMSSYQWCWPHFSVQIWRENMWVKVNRPQTWTNENRCFSYCCFGPAIAKWYHWFPHHILCIVGMGRFTLVTICFDHDLAYTMILNNCGSLKSIMIKNDQLFGIEYLVNQGPKIRLHWDFN